MVRVALVLYALVLALLLLRVPIPGYPDNLDASWQALLQHDWNTGARAGVESVFTYGPSGFLLGTKMVFMHEGAWERYVAAIVAAVVMAFSLTGLALRMPSVGWRNGYLLTLLVVAPFSYSSEVFACNLALGILVLLRLTGTPAPGATQPDAAASTSAGAWVLYGFACVVFALSATTKFTHFVQAGAQVAVLAIVLLLLRRVAAAGMVVVIFAVVFAAVWLGLGQALADFPTFVRSSLEIANGYNEGMSQRGPRYELLAAVILLGLNLVLALGGVITARSLPKIGAIGMTMMSLFLVWKGGFVRHDSGHAILFFGFAVLVPLFLLAAGARQVWRPLGFVATATVVGGLGLHLYVCESCGGGPTVAAGTLWRNVDMLRPQRFTADLTAAFARHELEHALPEIRQRVGDHAVDLMGYEQGILFAGGFGVHHRPVFQSYSAYTPYLQHLNGAFFAAANAPRFVLAKVQSVDTHFPLAEDSEAWKVLLARYFPVLAEKGYVLLERQDQAPELAEPSAIMDQHLAMGEWVELPPPGADWHELELDVTFTKLGKLAAFAFRPGDLLLDVRTSADLTFEIAPRLVRQSFLLDPCILGERDLIAAYLGGPVPRVKAFRVRPAPGKGAHYEPRFGMRLLRRPPPRHAPDPTDLARMQAHALALCFPSFSFLPERVEPSEAASALGAGADAWVLVHAPCALHFAWPGGKRVLSAEFEIAGNAYTGDGGTDGVVFRVEVGAEQPRRIVFERTLEPRARAEDQGTHHLRLELDLPASTPLVLTTSVGARGDSAWDWSCWRSVRLDP